MLHPTLLRRLEGNCTTVTVGFPVVASENVLKEVSASGRNSQKKNLSLKLDII